MYDYSAIYERILAFVKDKGIKRVVHKKLDAQKLSGYYNPANATIAITAKLRNTKEGCFVLLHEYSHFRQHKTGKHNRFFYPRTDMPEHEQRTFIEYVDAMEEEADESASKLLWENWSLYHRGDYDNNPSHYRKFWAQYYFKNKKLAKEVAQITYGDSSNAN